MKRLLCLLPILLCVFLLASCGDDDNPTGPEDGPRVYGSMPELFEGLVRSYTRMNSNDYASALDTSYVFQLVVEETEGKTSEETWDRETEIQITERMFSGWETPEGLSVNSISLMMSYRDAVEDTTDYPERGDQQIWYRINVSIDMQILMEDADAPGVLFEYMVVSDQIYIVRPDGINITILYQEPANYTVYKQIDQPFYVAEGEEAPPGQYTWTGIKEMFRDGYVPPPPPEPEPNSSPDSLIMAFEEAYASRDSSAYAALLDSAYTFLNLEEEIEGVWYPGELWDLDEELTIGGRMFSGWENGSGVNVQSISLDMIISSNVVDNTAYPGKPEGETWRKIIASVDMIIVVNDPSVGGGIMNYIILSNQIFIVRPDPLNDGLWVVYKQEDQLFANKGGTEETNWGEVKGLFR